ncbi:hypothetical protein IKE83_00650 [Candidatus Saccharibacteria bacterium]|nr:hypothetical protein [Candidatus Saccharibacteria bacterium]
MNKILRGLAAIGASTMMLGLSLVPLVRVGAAQQGTGDYELTLSVDSNASWLAQLTVNGVEWSETDSYLDEDGVYNLTIELHVPNEDVKDVTSVRTGGGSGPFEIQQAGATEDLGETTKFTFSANYTAPAQNSHVSLNPYSEENGGSQPGQGDGPGPQAGNTEATVILRGGDGSFTETVPGEGGEPEEHTVYYADTYHEASFAINGSYPYQMSPEDAVENEDYSSAAYSYDYDEMTGDNKVEIRLETLWHLRFVDAVEINGQSYAVADYINYDDQESYLAHYNGQIVWFTIPDVAKADTYDISVKVGRSDHTWIGNFLWTADPAQEFVIMRDEEGNYVTDGEGNYVYLLDDEGNKIPGKNYIGHSSLGLVAVEYTVGGKTYQCNMDELSCSWWNVGDEENVETCSAVEDNCEIPFLEFDSGNEEYDDGSLVIPAGAKVTMRVIPDYGYQVMT